MSVVSFNPRLLYPRGKSPWYILNRWLGGPRSCCGRFAEEKNLWPGFEPWHFGHPARRIVTLSTELSRRLYWRMRAVYSFLINKLNIMRNLTLLISLVITFIFLTFSVFHSVFPIICPVTRQRNYWLMWFEKRSKSNSVLFFGNRLVLL